jgi:hypothetical protein
MLEMDAQTDVPVELGANELMLVLEYVDALIELKHYDMVRFDEEAFSERMIHLKYFHFMLFLRRRVFCVH